VQEEGEGWRYVEGAVEALLRAVEARDVAGTMRALGRLERGARRLRGAAAGRVWISDLGGRDEPE